MDNKNVSSFHLLLHSMYCITASLSSTGSPLHETLEPLQEILEGLDSNSNSNSKSKKKVNALDGRIKHALWKFEDLVESLLSQVRTVLLSGSITISDGYDNLEEDTCVMLLPRLSAAYFPFRRKLEGMMEEYIYEANNMPDDEEEEEEDEEEADISSSAAKMIGSFDEFHLLQYFLLDEQKDLSIMSYSVLGMAGLGKTTLVRKAYEEPEVQSYYDRRIWIRVGRKYETDQASNVAAQLQGGERCLIVLDDVWETGVLPVIFTSLMEMKDIFIRILITARGRNVIRYILSFVPRINEETVLRFLNEEESKALLCEKVFGDQLSCPPQLNKAATKIAKNCEGLPLLILKVAERISSNRDPDYWNDVAEERNSVFVDSHEEISKVLYPSYDYLPQRLKMPFMHMGVFTRDHDIPLSKILSMWSAEGWLIELGSYGSLEDYSTECLEELCMSYNIVLFKPRSTRWFMDDSTDTLKTCRLHSSWRHLCRAEARKNKFFLVLKRLLDASPPPPQEEEDDDEEKEKEEEAGIVIKGQRGLCLENNILFGLKQFSSSVKCYCASSTRFLLFNGPYHLYPTPIDAIGFMLLRELDALQLRFYTFPTQILTLFQLKYLALTCNDQLPSTISKLSELRVLIIHPHLDLSIIKCHTAPSFVPVQIWDMAELEHIEILGKSFRPSNSVDACLDKLSTIIGVNADIGTISELSERIPNIKKFGIQVELMPCDTTSSCTDLILSCFNFISRLGSIMNPVKVLPASSYPCSLMLPHGLKKLHLSGMGFPWEYMVDAIASLPSLEVLKLRCYAFRGLKWEIHEGSFLKLVYLAIEDSDLVEWKPAAGSFPMLNYLSLKHCYRLRELDWPSDFGKIELVDCNPLAVTCANKLLEKFTLGLHVFASNDYQA